MRVVKDSGMIELQTGDVLIGRYALQKLLRQAHGIAVWRATDRVLAHDCQLVIITHARLASQASEIAGSLALSHNQYFTPIEQIRNADGSVLLVTALDRGTSVLRFILRAEANQTQPFSIEATRSIMGETIKAIASARAEGFNYPTISPAVIRVDASGVTLADAPLAYAFTPLVQVNAGSTQRTAQDNSDLGDLDTESALVHQLAATLYMMLTGDQFQSGQSYNPQMLREIDFDHQLFAQHREHIPEEFAILCERGLGLHVPGDPAPVPLSTLDEFSALLGDYQPIQILSDNDIQFPIRSSLQSIELIDFLDEYAGSDTPLESLPAVFAPERLSTQQSQVKEPEWTRAQLFSGHHEVEEATFEDFEQDHHNDWSYDSRSNHQFTGKPNVNNGFSDIAGSSVNNSVNSVFSAGAGSASSETVNLAQAAQEALHATQPTLSLDASSIRHPHTATGTLSDTSETDIPVSDNASSDIGNTSQDQAISDLSRLAKGGTQAFGKLSVEAATGADGSQNPQETRQQMFLDAQALEEDEEAPTQNILPLPDGPITVAQYAEQVRKAEQAKRAAQAQEARFAQEDQTAQEEQDEAAAKKTFMTSRVTIAVCFVAVLVALGVWAASALGVFETPSSQSSSSQGSAWPSINANNVPFPNESAQHNDDNASGDDKEAQHSESAQKTQQSEQTTDKTQHKQQQANKDNSDKTNDKADDKKTKEKTKVSNADKKASAVPAPKPENTTAYPTVRQTFLNRPGDLKGRGWYIRLDNPHEVSRVVISLRQSGGKAYIYAGATASNPTSGEQVGEFSFDPSGTTQVRLTKRVNTQDIVIWVPVDSTPTSASGAAGLYFNSVEVY